MPFDPTRAVPRYIADEDRYGRMPYRRVGASGLQLPAISLGLWQNFGDDRPLASSRAHPAPRVRPRHHALRPGQQLRPAVRLAAETNFGRLFGDGLPAHTATS